MPSLSPFREKLVDSVEGEVRFDQIAECHQIMHENRAPEGKMVALVGAPKAGMKDLKL